LEPIPQIEPPVAVTSRFFRPKQLMKANINGDETELRGYIPDLSRRIDEHDSNRTLNSVPLLEPSIRSKQKGNLSLNERATCSNDLDPLDNSALFDIAFF
jgi:hypothetical protein